MKFELKVSSMFMTGSSVFSRKLKESEVNLLIEQGGWVLVNERSPLLQKKILINKAKTISVSLRPTGNINIVGCLRYKQGERLYDSIIGELKHLVPGAMQK